MRLKPDIELGELAVRVGDALRRAGIRAVLTGGACAHLRSGGVYTSVDVDYVLTRLPTQAALDDAMSSLGFMRRGDHYEHPDLKYFVEFPPGPLAIGSDVDIRAVLLKRRRWVTRALSPTDSCRDRLAAFYHWNDRQALDAAIAIALKNPVKMKTIREWSLTEGAAEACLEFERAVKQRKAGRKSRG